MKACGDFFSVILCLGKIKMIINWSLLFLFVLGEMSFSWTNFPRVYERLQNLVESKASVSQERDHQILDEILSYFSQFNDRIQSNPF